MSNLLLPSRQSPLISPPNSPSACRDLSPTPSESNSELEQLVSILTNEENSWKTSPQDFFKAAPVNVEKYTSSDKRSVLIGGVALKLRTGQFVRCRKTWGTREKQAFMARVKGCEPEEGLSGIDFDKWMDFGGTTNIISQRCIPGTIVATCLLSLPDSMYRTVPRHEANEKHVKFLERLDSSEYKQRATQFAELEEALKNYISDKYSPLRKEPKEAPGYEMLLDFSSNLHNSQQALGVGSGCDPFPAEPGQDLIITSFSQDPTLDSMGQNNFVGKQQQSFAEHWQQDAQQYEDPSQQAQFVAWPCMNPLDSESTPGLGNSDAPMLVFPGTATIESAVFPLKISTTETNGIASVKRTLRC